MSKVKVYTSYGGMIGPDGTGPVDPETYYVSRYDYHALAARVRELEAAVRWKVDMIESLGIMSGGPNDPFGDCAAEIETWIDAHPIVRSVIEGGPK